MDCSKFKALEFSVASNGIMPILNFTKNRPVVLKLIHVDRQTAMVYFVHIVERTQQI